MQVSPATSRLICSCVVAAGVGEVSGFGSVLGPEGVASSTLLASFEHESAVQADCLSKSTMRLVAHEVVNNSSLANILYWPSFEIFRWAGSNASNYYAADDGAAWHVSEEKVAGTIKSFVEMFS